MGTPRYLPGLLFAMLLVGSAAAYNCLFGGSEYYPASNKAYCFASGTDICYYPYGVYLVSNCMRECCQKITPGFDSEVVTCGDPNAGYGEYDTLDSACDASLQQEVAGGTAIKMGFNAYCRFTNGATAQAGDEKKLDDCDVACAPGYLTQVAGKDWLTQQENCDSVPPSLRQCFDDFKRQQYGSGLACSWGSGTQTQQPPAQPPQPQQQGPCTGVVCGKKCEVKGGVATLSYDGTCVEAGPTGYQCVYSEKECPWGCLATMDGCVTVSPVQISITSPADGASIDTGASGVAFINVTGTVSNGQQYGVEEVLVNAGLDYPQPAAYDKASGSFSYKDIRIAQGRPVRITATASADNRGKTLGSANVVVYPAPQLDTIQFRCSGGVVYFRNSQPVDCTGNSHTMQDGDTLQLSQSGALWLTYTDGTMVVLKAPARVRIWKRGIYVDYGAVEVEVNHDYEVLTRQGHYVARGTHFKVIVPEDASQPESVVVMEGTVSTALADAMDTSVYVGKGQALTLVPGSPPTTGDVATADSSQLAYYFGYPPPAGVSAPAGSEGGGCCGSAFIMAFAFVGALMFSRR